MKFTQVAADTFSKLQLNAGVLLTDFDPSTATLDRSKIFGATGGGVSFSATAEYVDFGDDIDNVPNNTKELKKLDSVTAVMSGTFKAADTSLAKVLIGAADVDSTTGKVTPRVDLLSGDFIDVWWVGDYSDVNTGNDAGFMAIHLINALSTGGFSIQSNDKGKGDFGFEFTGHYSMDDIDVVPYELYIKDGSESSAIVTLSALAIGTLTLTPTFSANVTRYSTTTTNTKDAVDITTTDSDAKATIVANGNSVTDADEVTWEDGENVVIVTVTNGGRSKIYTVYVTKES